MEIKKFLEDQGIAYGTNVDVYDEDSGTWVGHSLAGLLSDFKDRLVKESDSLPYVSESLLAKYIQHVREYEGIDFIDRCNDGMASDVKFSDKELEVLKRLR